MLDQLRNLKYDLKKKILKFDVKCNLNLILAKLNFGIRTVVFCTQEFHTWKALNLINPTKYKQLFQSKRRLKKKRKKLLFALNTLFTVQGCSSYTRIAEGHDYVTSRSDEGFTLPDAILTRSCSLFQKQA